MSDKFNKIESEFEEKVIRINRVAKVVKGGRRFSFNALAVVGDNKSKVGIGFGKANEVPDAIRKGNDQARKNMFSVSMVQASIPHKIVGHFGAGRVVLRPASAGTGVIAGGAMRPVLEAVGIHDVLAKIVGSTTPHNVVHATIDALRNLQDAAAVAARRGKSIEDVVTP
jgi:small subunit ribosomal protein S5